MAGAGELPEGVLEAGSIISAGDTSPHGIESKARFVMDLMEARLRGLGGNWTDVSAIDVYTVHSIDGILPDAILRRIGAVGSATVNWCYSRPPIQDIEFEMDLRGIQQELRIE